jgi:diaminopimelate decarboxylase
MEDDILSAGLNFPDSVNIGDRILITDAGAYERSMTYEFARGGLGSTEGMADSPYI